MELLPLEEERCWRVAADLAKKFVDNHAVRGGDLCLPIKGKGQTRKWLPAAYLRAAFGWATTSALKTSTSLADRAITSMSLQSIGYWMQSTPSTISKVHDAVAQFFMLAQRLYCEAIMKSDVSDIQRSKRVGRLVIEFDETSQMQRVRFGVNAAHAVFSVMVQNSTLLVVEGKDAVKYTTILTAPAALRTTHSGGIWCGIVSKQPVHPMRWAKAFDVFILSFVSDAAPANMKLMRWIPRNLPVNGLFLHHICNMHEGNHCVEAIWRGLGINPMFCTANVITFGQTFMDLMLQSIAFIRGNMVVTYDPPDPEDRRFSQEIIRMTQLSSAFQEDKSSTIKKQRLQRIALFLNIFNGNWRSRDLKHHCSVFCPCGGLPNDQLADLAATLFVEIVLFGRPPIPALSRWMRCFETAQWFMFAGNVLIAVIISILASLKFTSPSEAEETDEIELLVSHLTHAGNSKSGNSGKRKAG